MIAYVVLPCPLVAARQALQNSPGLKPGLFSMPPSRSNAAEMRPTPKPPILSILPRDRPS